MSHTEFSCCVVAMGCPRADQYSLFPAPGRLRNDNLRGNKFILRITCANLRGAWFSDMDDHSTWNWRQGPFDQPSYIYRHTEGSRMKAVCWIREKSRIQQAAFILDPSVCPYIVTVKVQHKVRVLGHQAQETAQQPYIYTHIYLYFYV